MLIDATGLIHFEAQPCHFAGINRVAIHVFFQLLIQRHTVLGCIPDNPVDRLFCHDPPPRRCFAPSSVFAKDRHGRSNIVFQAITILAIVFCMLCFLLISLSLSIVGYLGEIILNIANQNGQF